jgi:hypothetical protein
MPAVPESIDVKYSHFDGVLGTESAPRVSDADISISADAIIQAFDQYDNDQDLEKQIALLLKEISSELNLTKVRNIKQLYILSENDQERAEAIAAARKLGEKIAFFSHLLSVLRPKVVEKLTNAHLDPRHFKPQFQETMEMIQARADDYQAQIGGFEEFIAREAQH